jgi:glycosyltransferase involved in cell wall biosynthesis
MTARVLRVGIDGRAFASPAAGVRRYVSELTRALAAPSAPADVVRNADARAAAGNAGADTDDPAIELIAIGAPDDVALPPGVQRAPEGSSAPTNFGRHLTGLPLAIARARLDLFHAPAYTAPVWGSTPVVLSIHDVSYARHPEWYPYRRDPLRRGFYRQSARRAAVILTISAFSKREIVAAYDIPPDRIIVTPLGVSGMFHPAEPAVRAGLAATAANADNADSAAETATAARAASASPFLLHVGDLHARRNLGIVVRAMARLRDVRVRLVLVGVDRGIGSALLEEAARLGIRDAIEMRGRVPDEELVTLYQQCAALVYPSRYEGFGFPLVEAMACGAPVIASNASAIPEVTGSAAVLLDPDDEQGFMGAIQRVLLDASHAASMRSRGLARAAQFTWADTAARTLEAYRRAALAGARSVR